MTQSTTFQILDSFLVYTDLDVDWKGDDSIQGNSKERKSTNQKKSQQR